MYCAPAIPPCTILVEGLPYFADDFVIEPASMEKWMSLRARPDA